jgi:hypothetical protein
MDLLLGLIIITAFIVVPGLLNYFTSRWLVGDGGAPGRWESVIAGFVLSFVLLTVAAMVTMLVSLGFDGLRTQIADFVRLGLRGYAVERPVALSGVLTAVALVEMAIMTGLGWVGIPGAYLK